MLRSTITPYLETANKEETTGSFAVPYNTSHGVYFDHPPTSHVTNLTSHISYHTPHQTSSQSPRPFLTPSNIMPSPYHLEAAAAVLPRKSAKLRNYRTYTYPHTHSKHPSSPLTPHPTPPTTHPRDPLTAPPTTPTRSVQFAKLATLRSRHGLRFASILCLTSHSTGKRASDSHQNICCTFCGGDRDTLCGFQRAEY